MGLVKVLIYELMKHHFDCRSYQGINYKIYNLDKLSEKELSYEENRISLVKDIYECLEKFNVKLAAAFARIRIENNASGNTLKEQMLNILSPEVQIKEDIAIEMNKTFRINYSKVSLEDVEKTFRNMGISFCSYQTVSEIE